MHFSWTRVRVQNLHLTIFCLQSAKVMFVVKESHSRKESVPCPRKTSSGKFLCWGLVTIADHQ